LLKRLSELADHGRFIADAPLCFAVFTKNDQKYRLEDGCAATMNIILAAQSHGLGTCWIAGDKKQYASSVGELLKVPKEYGLIALVPCGFPGETPQAKGKKGLAEVTFKNAVKPA